MAEELFHIKGDSPVKDDLMFWRIVGHEALSRPSFYELTVLSKNAKIEAKDILEPVQSLSLRPNDALCSHNES